MFFVIVQGILSNIFENVETNDRRLVPLQYVYRQIELFPSEFKNLASVLQIRLTSINEADT